MNHQLNVASAALVTFRRTFVLSLILSGLSWGMSASVSAAQETSPAVGEESATVPGTEQETGSATGAQMSSGAISRRWDEIFGPEAVMPSQPVSTSAARARQPQSGITELTEQFFFRLSVDYSHNWVDFSGRPTPTFLVNQGPPFTLTPEDLFSYPSAFENNDDRLYSRLVFGTKGYGSDRLNTYFSVVSYNDLDGTSDGSPFIHYTDSYDGRSRLDLVNAYFELNGMGEEGFLSHMNLRVGRQYTHSFTNDLYPLGATVMDGASADYRDERFNIGAFVGYRPSLFSDPDFRLVTGFNFGVRGSRAAFNYDAMYYADSLIHSFTVEPRFEIPLHLQGHFRMVNGHPVQVGVRSAWLGDRWTVHANLSDQLSNDDFIYDIFINSPLSPFKRLRAFPNDDIRTSEDPRRLFLGLIEPSLRFSVDANRQFTSWLNLGARLWLLELHDQEEQSGFDTSFRDYSANAAITPGEHWELMGEYRYRDVDRGNPLGAEFFDDIENAGETQYQEFVGSVGYRSHRLWRAQLGTYYRLFDLQNRLTIIDNSKTNGIFANLFLRVNRNVDFRVIYGSDNDYFIFNPDIDRQHGLRIGFDFHN